MEAPAKIAIRRDVMVVPCTEGLRVLHPDRRVLLESKTMATIHQKLAPYLDGRYTEAQMLQAVPAEQQTSLETYFRTLRRTDVFTDGATEPDASQATALINLDNALPDPASAEVYAVRFEKDIGLRIWFVATSQPHEVLLHLDTLFAAETPLLLGLLIPWQKDQFLDNEASSFLLHLAESWAASHRSMASAAYRVDPLKGTAQGLCTHNTRDRSATMATQLGLVGPSKTHPQLPLLCLEASHNLLPPTVHRIGTDRATVATAARDAFLAHLAAPQTLSWLTSASEPPALIAVDSNPDHARLQVMERAAWARVEEPHATSLDLLQLEPRDATEQHLLEVLQRRHSSMPCRKVQGPQNMQGYRVEQAAVFSAYPAVARRKALILAAACTYLPDEAWSQDHIAVSPPHEASAPEKQVATLRAALGLPLPSLEHTRLWGHNLYTATLPSELL